jgi:hypothetical protein
MTWQFLNAVNVAQQKKADASHRNVLNAGRKGLCKNSE